MKKIMIASFIESIGMTLLGTAWMLWNGKIMLWWGYLIEIAFMFVGLSLMKIGFEKWVKE